MRALREVGPSFEEWEPEEDDEEEDGVSGGGYLECCGCLLEDDRDGGSELG
jgi:hypothetical protein